MAGLIATIILFGSLCGIAIILLQKIPFLCELPHKESRQFSLSLNIPLFENVPQKFLRKIKILTLKTENKISYALEQLERDNKTYKNKFKDNYWEGLKDSKNPHKKIKVTSQDIEDNAEESVKKSAPR